MNVLIYPHCMEIGGAQLNALQIAGAIQDRGHTVAVVSEQGPLVARVIAMGLEHIQIPDYRVRPSPAVIGFLRKLARQRAVDVIHGHEWPPIIEAFLGAGLANEAAVVGTVMSMSVASFVPRTVHLTVGTEVIRQAALAAGHRFTMLLEPPVDTEADHPLIDGRACRAAQGIGEGDVLIAAVCRFVPDLKLEGLLAACEAVGEMALAGEPVRLMLVGDGPARAEVAARAEKVNARVGRRAILLTGEMADPRPAYAAADIVIGQGGSALRGMAFGKPLVVIGEDGFSELLTPQSAGLFLAQGWYGLGPGSRGAGVSGLRSALQAVVGSSSLRAELGAFGRRLVEQRFSLARAANIVEGTYLSAIRDKASTPQQLADAARCAAGLISHKLQRRYQRWAGAVPSEDSNDRARISSILSSRRDGATAALGETSAALAGASSGSTEGEG